MDGNKQPTTEKLAVCFDLDDTLIDDNYKFEITYCDCVKTILVAFETKAPQIDEVLQLARAIDNQKLEEWEASRKFLPERLLSTWQETYEQLCEKYKIPAKPHTKLLLEGLVRQNFDPPYYLIPNAIEALMELRKDPDLELYLITSGSKEIQQKKVDSLDLEKFFYRILIATDGNKKQYLENLASYHGKDKVLMVGNSMRSDINPALELGIRAVHIPRGSWHQFRAEPATDQYDQLEDIGNITELIQKWRGVV